MRGAFQSCGQNCAGAERFLVHSAVYDRCACPAAPMWQADNHPEFTHAQVSFNHLL